MLVSVASGKGGTGKTTVSLLLAVAGVGKMQLLDCDVEEPNCHLFFSVRSTETQAVTVMNPVIDKDVCSKCGLCAKECLYRALVITPVGPIFFPELCHGCGACILVCPTGACGEGWREVGLINDHVMDDLEFVEGRLNVGETMAGPVISRVKKEANTAFDTVIDCPPGTSCSMIKAVKESDFCLLVTEPTLFGQHDLALAMKVIDDLNIPGGIIINKSGPGKELIESISSKHRIPILAELPFDPQLAKAYAKGKLFDCISAFYREVFSNIWGQIRELVKKRNE